MARAHFSSHLALVSEGDCFLATGAQGGTRRFPCTAGSLVLKSLMCGRQGPYCRTTVTSHSWLPTLRALTCLRIRGPQAANYNGEGGAWESPIPQEYC